MKKWVAKYQIHEFIPANETGLGPSGRLANNQLTKAENEGRLDTRVIWTLEDNEASDRTVFTSEFSIGLSRYNRGWCGGGVAHENGQLIFDAGKLACRECEGQGFLEDSEGDEVDCELCEGGRDEHGFSP